MLRISYSRQPNGPDCRWPVLRLLAVCGGWSLRSRSSVSFQRDVQNLVVRLPQDGEGFGVRGSTVKFHLDQVLAALELEDWHSVGNIAYENIVDVNSCGVSIQSLWSDDVDLHV